jgi:hypothetical protein
LLLRGGAGLRRGRGLRLVFGACGGFYGGHPLDESSEEAAVLAIGAALLFELGFQEPHPIAQLVY